MQADIDNVTINGVYSREREYFDINKVIRIKKDDTSDKWLGEMDRLLCEGVKHCIKKSWEDMPESREDWILTSKAQAVLAVGMTRWTEDVEDFLADESPVESLRMMGEELNGYIRGTSDLIRSENQTPHQLKLAAIITQDVHCRDIVSGMV